MAMQANELIEMFYNLAKATYGKEFEEWVEAKEYHKWKEAEAKKDKDIEALALKHWL